MFSFSIKQFIRQPGKALLFFLLMAASTALVVTGAVLTAENSERIKIVEDTYSTVGYIEQTPLNTESVPIANPCTGSDWLTSTDYGDYIFPEDLDFPGAGYIMKPEQRPYCIIKNQELITTLHHDGFHFLEFTPLEPVGDDGGAVEVEITRVLLSEDSSHGNGDVTIKNAALHEGDNITVCQCFGTTRYPMEVGERYLAELYPYTYCEVHEADEYVIYHRPCSLQSDREGNYIDKGAFPDDIDWGYKSPGYAQVAHVTGDDFYEKGNIGYNYILWAEHLHLRDHLFGVVPTNSLELLPSWHENEHRLIDGREITPEEFESGAPVCMVHKELSNFNKLSVGDKVSMEFLCSAYRDFNVLGGDLPYSTSILNADGEYYEPFFRQEYEIVGTFSGGRHSEIEIGENNMIIPAKSVAASDEDHIAGAEPMTKYTASFQIPNGSIQKFDQALHKHVPEAERLSITYDDRGYSEIRKSLDNSRAMALLLLLAGVMAALSIIALLLYFFVAKEKKRTAVERSLGMTKAQCRVSLLSALMILTVLSASAGSAGGMLALGRVQEPKAAAKTAEERDSMYDYDTRYSTWAAGRELAEKAEIEVETPIYLSCAVPLSISLIVLIPALLLMAAGFRTDPIYLLSTREKE